MNDRIADAIRVGIGIGFAVEKVEQAVFAHKTLSIENDTQSRVKETVVPYLLFKVFRNKMKMLKDVFIRNEADKSAIFFPCFCFLMLLDQYPSLKFRHLHLSFPERGDLELLT